MSALSLSTKGREASKAELCGYNSTLEAELEVPLVRHELLRLGSNLMTKVMQKELSGIVRSSLHSPLPRSTSQADTQNRRESKQGPRSLQSGSMEQTNFRLGRLWPCHDATVHCVSKGQKGVEGDPRGGRVLELRNALSLLLHQTRSLCWNNRFYQAAFGKGTEKKAVSFELSQAVIGTFSPRML